MRRIGGDHQTGLLTQLATQSRQPVFAGFDAAAWGCPDGRRLRRSRRVRKVEPAEQDAVALIKDDRADAASQLRRHGVSDLPVRRMPIDTAADQPAFRTVERGMTGVSRPDPTAVPGRVGSVTRCARRSGAAASEHAASPEDEGTAQEEDRTGVPAEQPAQDRRVAE
nr:hypothetical protein [Cryptosporangium arvum]